MGPMLIGGLVGAGLGVLKGREEKRNARNRQYAEAMREMWSPWTGRRGEFVDQPSSMGPIMQGAMAGAMLGQGMGGGGAAEAGATGGPAVGGEGAVATRAGGPAMADAGTGTMMQPSMAEVTGDGYGVFDDPGLGDYGYKAPVMPEGGYGDEMLMEGVGPGGESVPVRAKPGRKTWSGPWARSYYR